VVGFTVREEGEHVDRLAIIGLCRVRRGIRGDVVAESGGVFGEADGLDGATRIHVVYFFFFCGYEKNFRERRLRGRLEDVRDSSWSESRMGFSGGTLRRCRRWEERSSARLCSIFCNRLAVGVERRGTGEGLVRSMVL